MWLAAAYTRTLQLLHDACLQRGMPQHLRACREACLNTCVPAEGRLRFDQLSAEHQAQFNAMVGLLGVLTERQQQADNVNDHPRSTVQLRVQQARTMLALMQIHRASLKGGFLESCRRAVTALASDGSYGARREAAWLAPLLLQQCASPEVPAPEEIVFGGSAAAWHRRCKCLAVPPYVSNYTGSKQNSRRRVPY